jgi:RraA family protein
MIGLRILERTRAVSPASARRFLDIPVANVSDCMARLFAGGAALRPLHGGGAMAGAAFTVRTRPGDNLMVHKALALASPGDVLVVDAGGDLSNAIVGEIMAGQAMQRGLAGLVIHGAVRDARALREGALPVYAAGVTHRGPYKDGPGEINVPVAFGGMVVHPGDLVIGDDDGLLCVPYDAVEAMHAAALEKVAYERKMVADIRAGTHDTAWVDAQLRRLGCALPD